MERKKSISYLAELVKKKDLSDLVSLLTLAAPEIARSAIPGQFVQIKTSNYLRRPIGIMSVDREAGEIEIGIRRVGKGSNEICDLKLGEQVDLLGPLGKGFSLAGKSEIIVVGGGTGLFPLIFLLEEAGRKNIISTVVIGFKNANEAILLERIRSVSDKQIFASEEGGLDFTGHAGAAFAYIANEYKDLARQKERILIAACGPNLMLESIASQAADSKLDCQISLEARMACGIGVCAGCSVPVYNKNKDAGQLEEGYERCCYDGPVFAAERIIWPSQGGVW